MGFFYDRFIAALPGVPALLNADKFANAAVLVPFLDLAGEEYLVFEKRAEAIRQGGEICFPGGMIDTPGESPRGAAVRETVEELGIDAGNIAVGGHLGFLVANMGAVLDVFVGKITADGFSDFRINKKEVDSLHFVPFSFFLDTRPDEYSLETEVRSSYTDETGKRVVLFPAKELGIPERYHRSWTTRKTKVYVYTYHGLVIWGLTAEILCATAKTFAKGQPHLS
jgi:8-oxo-dGTP pyrophosphatase MutT (NUDIX family)